jgi:hypothetical protein
MGYPMPQAVLYKRLSFCNEEPVKDQPWLQRPCTQPGFTEPAPLDAAGALLPHLCTLTCIKVKAFDP